MPKEVPFCRPDSFHWCVECCEGRRCFNLGVLPDGTRGCLGYRGRRDLGGFSQLSSCQDLDCLKIDLYHPEIATQISQAIVQLPVGEFKLSAVLKKLDL